MIEDHDRLEGTPARETALACLEAGFDAARPERIVDETVALDGGTLRILGERYDLDDFDRLVAVGGGKAAGRLAAGLERILGDRIAGGAVVTDSPVDTDRIELLPGDHPVPTPTGVESTRRMLELLESADERTLVLAIVTGGGSALMVAPSPDVSLEAVQRVTESLLRSGATIHEINAVRKHLSTIKGGWLARAAAPATVVGLILSDVVGNDLSVIASGPTTPDASTFEDALAVLDRYDIDAPSDVRERLERGVAGDVEETPGPDDPAFDRVTNSILADGSTPILAARSIARDRGYETLYLSSRIRGESRVAAGVHASIVEEMRATGNPIEPPVVVLSGGETTVAVRGDGLGGPNQEFALGAGIELRAVEAVAVVSVDTDGIDGPTDAAGGLVDGTTVRDVDEARAALDANDVYPYLDARDALVRTGRTGTNLNDFRVVVVERR